MVARALVNNTSTHAISWTTTNFVDLSTVQRYLHCDASTNAINWSNVYYGSPNSHKALAIDDVTNVISWHGQEDFSWGT